MISSYKRKEIEKLLRAYFPQLSQEQLIEEISEFGEIIEKEAGEMVIDFGAYVRFLPLVIKGSLKISRINVAGEEIFLYFVGPGDTCASSFSCCMTQKKSLLKAEAEEDVSFISVPLKYADLWMSRYPQWRNFDVQMYDKRLMELIETLDTIAFSRMDERLMEYLQKKSDILNTTKISITHQEIATDMNASREAVSRLLKKIEKDGLIKLGRNQLELKI